MKSVSILGRSVPIMLFTVFVVIYSIKAFSSPLLFGIDGPYYYIQLRSIHDKGFIKYPDPPLAFYLLYLFALMLKDIVMGIKIGSILLILLTIIPTYYLISRLFSNYSALISCTFLALTPALLRMCFDFIKNGVGLLFMVATLLLTMYSIMKRKVILSLTASLTAIMTGLTHSLSFATLYLILIILTITLINKNSSYRYLVPQVLSSSIFILASFFVLSLMGSDVYKLFGLVNSSLQSITNPYMAYKLFLGRLIRIVLIAIPIISLTISRVDYNVLRTSFIKSLAITTLILSAVPYSSQFAMRFDLMSELLTSILLGVIISYYIGFGNITQRYVVSFIILILLMPPFINTYLSISPSITLQEYRELKKLTVLVPKNTTFIVPNTKLRYWLETLTSNVYRSLQEVSKRVSTNLVLVLEKYYYIHHQPKIPKSPPPMKHLIILHNPNLRVIYNGKFIIAFLVRKF